MITHFLIPQFLLFLNKTKKMFRLSILDIKEALIWAIRIISNKFFFVWQITIFKNFEVIILQFCIYSFFFVFILVCTVNMAEMTAYHISWNKHFGRKTKKLREKISLTNLRSVFINYHIVRRKENGFYWRWDSNTFWHHMK